jgi:hypothetical protein
MEKDASVSRTESEAARRLGAELDRIEPLAKKARFVASTDALFVELKSGASFTLPRKLLPKPFRARRAQLEDISIDPPGTGIWFNDIDAGIHVTTLMEILVGQEWIRSRGAAFAGSAKSSKKAAASRRNGAAGGRPRKARELATA